MRTTFTDKNILNNIHCQLTKAHYLPVSFLPMRMGGVGQAHRNGLKRESLPEAGRDENIGTIVIVYGRGRFQ